MSAILDHAILYWRQHEPETRIEDAYKWLFHATLGGEHAISNEEGVRRWLDEEWETLGEPFPGEPEAVALRPGGGILRANLRPYRSGGGDKEAMLRAFIDSARSFHAERTAFVSEWIELGERLRRGPEGRLTREEWERLDAATALRRYPAIDHSDVYETVYRPAYRVVLGDVWSVK